MIFAGGHRNLVTDTAPGGAQDSFFTNALIPMLQRYKNEDPFENHPLFKTEEQARLEETMDGEEPAVAPETLKQDAWPEEEPPTQEEGLWSRSRDFDWGD